MATSDRNLPPVPYTTPAIDRNGLVTQPWAAFFRQLFFRVGGHAAKTNTELDENGTKTFSGSGAPAGDLGGSSVGDFYFDSSSKKFYKKTGTATWTEIATLSGEDGDPGAAATVEVGTVTTGAAGSSASVTNSGTTSAAVLNFTIPKGDDGTGTFPYIIESVVTVPAKHQVVLFQQATLAAGGSLQVLGRMRIL